MKLKYASLLQRASAQIIDYLFFCALFFPITYAVKGVWIMSLSEHDWNWGKIAFDPICLIFLIFIFLYFIILEAFFCVTIGKKIMKIAVVDSIGNKPGLVKSIIRNLLRMVDGLPAMQALGIYLILKTPKNTRLGDIVAKTVVIKIK